MDDTVTERLWQGRNRDGDLPRLAASRGWRALEILSSHRKPVGWEQLGPTNPAHELVLMDAACMHGAHGLPTGCLPLPTYTGWRPHAAAGRECVCDGRRLPELLNCGGTPMT